MPLTIIIRYKYFTTTSTELHARSGGDTNMIFVTGMMAVHVMRLTFFIIIILIIVFYLVSSPWTEQEDNAENEAYHLTSTIMALLRFGIGKYSLQQMRRSQHEHFLLSSTQSGSCLTPIQVPFHCCYSKPHSLLLPGCCCSLAAVLGCILYHVSSSSYFHQDISPSVQSNHCPWSHLEALFEVVQVHGLKRSDYCLYSSDAIR